MLSCTSEIASGPMSRSPADRLDPGYRLFPGDHNFPAADVRHVSPPPAGGRSFRCEHDVRT